MYKTLGVIVPVYNTEKYIRECLDSLLSQSVPFDEIIIINDGSTDKTKDICEEYASCNKNIVLVNQENQGQASARNYGMSISKSDYICFVDSDDYIEKNYVETVKKQIDNELDILFFDAETVSEISGAFSKDYYNRKRIVPQKMMTGIEFLAECYPDGYRESPCISIYKKQFLVDNNIVFPKVRIYEDNYYSFVANIRAQKLLYLPKKLYVRRYRADSTMTSVLTSEKWLQLVECIYKCWQYIEDNSLGTNEHIKDIIIRFLMHTYVSIYWISKKICNNTIDINNSLEMMQRKMADILQTTVPKAVSFETAKEIMEFHMISQKIHVSLCKTLNHDYGLIDSSYDIYTNELKNILRRLPLQSFDKIVGIYGTGNHTERLLGWYVRLVGSIKSRIVFIETNCVSEEKCYMGRPIINCDDVSKYNVEEIIVSSILFEDDMVENLSKQIGYKGLIYRFYEKNTKEIFLNVKDTATDWFMGENKHE